MRAAASARVPPLRFSPATRAAIRAGSGPGSAALGKSAQRGYSRLASTRASTFAATGEAASVLGSNAPAQAVSPAAARPAAATAENFRIGAFMSGAVICHDDCGRKGGDAPLRPILTSPGALRMAKRPTSPPPATAGEPPRPRRRPGRPTSAKLPRPRARPAAAAEEPAAPPPESSSGPAPEPGPTPDPAFALPGEAQRQMLETLSLNLARAAMTAQAAIAEAALAQADRPAALSPDPFNVGPAMTEVMSGLASRPDKLFAAQADLFNRYLDLWASTTRRAAGEDAAPAPPSKDKRFKDPAWSENPMFDVMRQSYLVTADWMNGLVSSVEDIDPRTKRRAEFFTRLLTDAFSPSNFLASNPAALKALAE